jgi:hypothetical protein
MVTGANASVLWMAIVKPHVCSATLLYHEPLARSLPRLRAQWGGSALIW